MGAQSDREAALPSTCPASFGSPDGDQSEVQFCNAIQNAYEKVVGWRRNLFNIPFGASGKAFVDVLAALIKGFADATPLREIAWQAVCVACHLLLQKPNTAGSVLNYSQLLERRLALWSRGQISELLEESLCVQDHLPSRKSAGQNQAKFGPSDTVFQNWCLLERSSPLLDTSRKILQWLF